MSRLLLVRHGQSLYTGEQADHLTPLGREQARLLGERWAARGLRLDRVICGPRMRHHETLEEVRRSLELPEARIEPDLDEYPAGEIFKRAVQGGLARVEDPSTFERMFTRIMGRYVAGEIDYEGVETFSAFRARVGGALERITAEGARGQIVAAFTSGGPVAAALGLVLGLTDEKVLELSWTVRNTALCELRFGPGRLSLVAFNLHSHLGDDQTTVR